MIIKFGRYYGRDVKELPMMYLKWLWSQKFINDELRTEIRNVSFKYDKKSIDNGIRNFTNPVTGERNRI